MLIGTGSEVELAMQAARALASEGIAARVVSMPCSNRFDHQPVEYRERVLPRALHARVGLVDRTARIPRVT